MAFLLPVWGHQFIRRFLEFSLPTLLSPNNIPALARELPCRFILLTRENDEQTITLHPLWQELAQICSVESVSIDDLITSSNHTATITLGFERALRRAGHAMRQTCFIFLMSDYLVADGSLTSVLATVRKGARCVLVGNFQIVDEGVELLLHAQSDSLSSKPVLCPRDLMQFSMARLHPATIANIVNFGLTHNAHCNRLFWRVDERTLIGRFFLMHPIAIHPEVEDFAVGSSWDYSFVPELCPSGNVTTLTDSDEYLVVELQRRQYEWEHLRAGPFDPRELGQSLLEWTTARHRLNVEQKLVFHGGDLPADLPGTLAQSDDYIDEIRKLLTSPPLSHRDHPYWIGSFAANRRDARRPLDRDDWKVVLSATRTDRGVRARLQQLAGWLLGLAPDVTRAHPRWSDYQPIRVALQDVLDSGRRALLVAREPAEFAQWLSRQKKDVCTISIESLLQIPRQTYQSLVGTFDSVLFILGEESLETSDTLISYAAAFIRPFGTCNLLFLNERPRETATEFQRHFAREAARLWKSCLLIEVIQYSEVGPLKLFVRRVFNALRRRLAAGSYITLYAMLAACPLLLASYLANLTRRTGNTPPAGIWSSVFVSLYVREMSAADFPALCRQSFQSDEVTLGNSERDFDHRSGLRTVSTPSFSANRPSSLS